MKSAEIFDAGYAIPCYDISHQTRTWRYREQTVTLPASAVSLVQIPGFNFNVAKWSDVQKAMNNESR